MLKRYWKKLYGRFYYLKPSNGEAIGERCSQISSEPGNLKLMPKCKQRFHCYVLSLLQKKF